MKDLDTIRLDSTKARQFLDDAKSVLSPLNRPKGSALPRTEAQKAWFLVDQAEAYLDGLISYLSMMPIERGRKGGTKTAERGPEYFAKIAAMRKTRAGGRPKKQAATDQT